METLIAEKKPLAGWLVIRKAEKVLPSDAELRQAEEANTETVAVHSDPAGAEVAIQDYLTPDAGWQKLGTTPMESVRIPGDISGGRSRRRAQTTWWWRRSRRRPWSSR